MPRGYSYDHYQVPKREPRERATTPDRLKAATSKKGDAVPLAESQQGLHYGQTHAETTKRLRARAQKRQAQRTVGTDAPAQVTRAKAKKAAPVGTTRGASAKAPARGGKTVGRVAAAAKKVVQRAAGKITSRKAPKKR
jgi:hypothetical protein